MDGVGRDPVGARASAVGSLEPQRLHWIDRAGALRRIHTAIDATTSTTAAIAAPTTGQFDSGQPGIARIASTVRQPEDEPERAPP